MDQQQSRAAALHVETDVRGRMWLVGRAFRRQLNLSELRHIARTLCRAGGARRRSQCAPADLDKNGSY